MPEPLTPNEFEDFYIAVNQRDGQPPRRPFPWQQALVEQIFANDGRWPPLLDLPTASGKTTSIEIALFTLAAGLPVPRRVFFVVDRRVIVQQAAVHARHIQTQLRNPAGGILLKVANALRELHAHNSFGDADDPFLVAELRGATQQDPRWAERSDLPAIIASTVDQIGSRLLFRGYGVSERMLPIHAGLVGNDALILLDEVHLARPFATLLATIKERFRPSSELPDRWQTCELSATPGVDDDSSFRLSAADWDDGVLGKRLQASKPARLEQVKVPADPNKAIEALAKEHAVQALSLYRAGEVRSLGVIVNRVRLATRIAQILQAEPEFVGTNTVKLVTGRMRGIDRESVITDVQQRVGSGATTDDPTIVVATQTIEAGADLDFDAIVTDCASVDALIQRFGRVNRLGMLVNRTSNSVPESVIVGTNRTETEDDPIYGPALSETWKWLRARPDVDFGMLSMQGAFDGIDRESLSVPVQGSPHLLRSHMDRLVRTSPIPHADIRIADFLHGLGTEADQDVEVIWRADIHEHTLTQLDLADPEHHGSAALTAMFKAVRPAPAEALALPLSHVRNWLSKNLEAAIPLGAGELSDIESCPPTPGAGRYIRPVVIVRPDSAFVTTRARDIRPGDTIAVPSTYGGLTLHNFDPTATEPVTDVADTAGLVFGQATLRLLPETLPHVDDDPSRTHSGWANSIPNPPSVEEAATSPRSAIREWLAKPETVDHLAAAPSAVSASALSSTLRANRIIEVVLGGRSWFVVTADAKRVVSQHISTGPISVTTDPEDSPMIAQKYGLLPHLEDVRECAEAAASAVGLTGAVRKAVSDAAALHDVGKADPRFQAYLNEGELIGGAPLLAKSSIPRGDRQRNHRAHQESGYPAGIRHEVASLSLLNPDADTTVRTLIGTHHGFGRPFFPPQVDAHPTAIDIGLDSQEHLHTLEPYADAGVGATSSPDFWHAVEQFGWYGAAWLETILRLADHAASRMAATVGPAPEQERDAQ